MGYGGSPSQFPPFYNVVNMKVALIQLSDIHFSSKRDLICSRHEAFCRSCKYLINECSKVIFVISGDIANYGTEEQYNIAYQWLKECEIFWKKESRILQSFDYVVVPGNHDCMLSDSNPIRDLVIKEILKKDITSEDKYVDQSLDVQRPFWDFYKRLTGSEISPAVSWQVNIRIKLDLNLCFHCYNTALLSQLNEEPGKLMIPENYFLDAKDTENQVIVSVFHHNTGWLTAATNNNNKKMFEEHLYKTSSIVMCGHEHHQKNIVVSDLENFKELIYLESPALQEGKKSEYDLLLLDTDLETLTNHHFYFNDDSYGESVSNPKVLPKRQIGIGLKPEWVKSLSQISIPLKHARKNDLTLQDIFIYPDLEPLDGFENRYEQYMDSEQIISNIDSTKVLILEGDNQSGKTSLLNMLYLSYYRKGIYPILLQGKDLKRPDLATYVKKEYKRQYLSNDYSFEKYFQLDKDKRVLLIDNFDGSELNNAGKSALLDNALNNFDKVIAINGQQLNIKSMLIHTSNEKDIKRYRIVSLGYKKRNMLIDKWVRLGLDEYTLDQKAIFDQVKLTFDQLNGLLGQQLIPSYPVFILSLLQGLNASIDFDVSKTSYGFCYSSLIMASLIKTGTERNKVSGVLKYLADFAFFFYKSTPNAKCFSKKAFFDFWIQYDKEYNPPFTATELLRRLLEADLLRKLDIESFTFSYKYIFYFLVAQKISELVNSGEDDGIVKRLCENLHKEREANILIFLVYHNGVDKQMDELKFASWLPFEDYEPITLNKEDPLFIDLNDIVDNIKAKVLRNDVDPLEERQKQLESKDKIARSDTKPSLPTETDFEQNKDLRDINNTFKIIKILGQIVKNQKETMKKDDLNQLIEVSYNVCFRSIAFFNKMVDDCKGDIVSYFTEQNKEKGKLDSKEIKDRVWKFLHMMLYRQCLMAFGSLSHAIGTNDMEGIYDDIADKIGSPAAKIITFTIKTIYGKMRLADLQDIVNEYKDNPVVLEIIKARVISYVYNNYVDFSTRQKIGQLCKLRLVDNTGINQKKLYNRD